MKIPFSLGRMHFVGIGGIGMSGLAEVLHAMGCTVSGSDHTYSNNVFRLQKKGILVHRQHDAEHIKGADLIVVSTAIPKNNVELIEAQKQNIPIVHRSVILAGLMRLKCGIAISGTHGKTTTTSIISHIFDQAKLDPTVITGGIIRSYGTNARVGRGHWCIAETDESDGSFIHVPASAIVITNIDEEHMDFYKTKENLYQYFLQFIHNVPFYGIAFLCEDDPGIRHILPSIHQRRIITYGTQSTADIQAYDITQTSAGLTFSVRFNKKISAHDLSNISLSMHGHHNVLNTLAAIGICHEINIPWECIIQAITSFSGVERRFMKLGSPKGITIIDDYAHHPTEIEAVLKTAKSLEKRVIAVFQPHRYTRISSFMKDFIRVLHIADFVVVLPVYAAGDPIVAHINEQTIANQLPCAYALKKVEDLPHVIQKHAKRGDYVICLGAGDITTYAHNLVKALSDDESS